MVRMLFATLVFVCMSITVLGGFQAAHAQEDVEALSDLVGARAGQAESALNSRGYTWVKTEKSDDSAYSYWTEDKTGKCVTIRTSDGRYQSIVYAPEFDCQADDSSAAESQNGTVEMEGECALYNDKSGDLRYKTDCTVTHEMTDDVNTYVIQFNNGKRFKFIEKENDYYEVQKPSGKADKLARKTGSDTNMEFKWGKLRVTADLN